MSAVSDPIGDYLTRLRNASMAGREDVRAPYSRMKEEITKILQKEGYLKDYTVENEGVQKELVVHIRFSDRKAAITGLKRVSRPGLRKYVGSTEIPRVLGGLGIAVLSTSRGILSGREARRQKLGGELLAYIW